MICTLSTLLQPGISQSVVQMVTYYSVCHVDTTTLHLLGTEESSWVKNWYDNLMKEIVSDSLVSFSSNAEYLNGQKSMFDVLMRWYSTHATTPIIPPAPYTIYLVSPDAMGGIPDNSFADEFMKHICKLRHWDFLAGISPRECAVIMHGGWEKMGISPSSFQ